MTKFFDRQAAGISLAKKLRRYRNQDAVVFALPKGGVPVAYEVAKALQASLDVVLVQRITHPVSRDYAIAAVCENGDVLIDECGACGLATDWLNNALRLGVEEARRQRYLYTAGQPSRSAEDKIAILVDDGVSSSIAMKAAIQTIQDQWPGKLVVATPVAPRYATDELRHSADEAVVVQEDVDFLGAVSSYYVDYREVSDYDVKRYLESAASHAAPLAVQTLPNHPKFIYA